MRRTDACTAYPARWIVVESKGEPADIDVIEVCADGRAAMYRYRELCHLHPERTFDFFHTSYPSLELSARCRFLDDERAA
jgi:hypothetical protein